MNTGITDQEIPPLQGTGSWESNKEEITPIQDNHHKPSVPRLLLRIWQFFAAIGGFGFQVGATPYSGVPFPFEKTKSLYYYGYAICWVSVLWSSFHIFVYLSRRFGQGKKVKRIVATLLDWIMVVLFGICVFYEIALYQCKPGDHHGWCNFYNTGLFFLMSLFFTYIIHALWDIFGAMSCLRK